MRMISKVADSQRDSGQIDVAGDVSGMQVAFLDARGPFYPHPGGLARYEDLPHPRQLMRIAVALPRNELASHFVDKGIQTTQSHRAGAPGAGGKGWFAQIVVRSADKGVRRNLNSVKIDSCGLRRAHPMQTNISGAN